MKTEQTQPQIIGRNPDSTEPSTRADRLREKESADLRPYNYCQTFGDLEGQGETDLWHLIDRLYSACNSAYPWLCKAKASQVEKNTVLPRALDIAISNVKDAARQAQETLKKHGRI